MIRFFPEENKGGIAEIAKIEEMKPALRNEKRGLKYERNAR